MISISKRLFIWNNYFSDIKLPVSSASSADSESPYSTVCSMEELRRRAHYSSQSTDPPEGFIQRFHEYSEVTFEAISFMIESQKKNCMDIQMNKFSNTYVKTTDIPIGGCISWGGMVLSLTC